jgi:hypothetical protein
MNFERAHLRLLAILSSTLFTSGMALADVPVNAAPPAQNRAVAAKADAARLALPDTAPVRSIELPAPSLAERGRVKAQNSRAAASARGAAAGGKGRPLAIGFGRGVAAGMGTIALESLPWQTLPDGARAARLQVTSPDAAALRVAMQVNRAVKGVSVSFAGGRGAVFGPVSAATIADETARYGSYWSPTLEGSTATLEFHAAAGAKLDGVTVTIPRHSHHLVAGLYLKRASAKLVDDIGTAGPCNIDVKCVVPQTTALADSAKSVAEVLVTWRDGSTVLCTGTLMNDSIASNAPYFFFANHCLEDTVETRSTDAAAAARTINTFWFFDAISCGNLTPPPYVQQATGATLIARSEDWDWTLLRLVAPPPAGASFSAWRADPVATGAAIAVLHHPNGDLKKWAQGTSPGYQSFTDGSSFIEAVYSQGTTEVGSSGAPLFTFNATNTYYEIRGGLFGGEASCQNPAGTDIFSRLDTMLPLTRQYLTPGNNPSATVVAVEFYNRGLQHYFLSTSSTEINDLDTGVHFGWERTGLRLLA